MSIEGKDGQTTFLDEELWPLLMMSRTLESNGQLWDYDDSADCIPHYEQSRSSLWDTIPRTYRSKGRDTNSKTSRYQYVPGNNKERNKKTC
jgi:hypothetical protein